MQCSFVSDCRRYHQTGSVFLSVVIGTDTNPLVTVTDTDLDLVLVLVGIGIDKYRAWCNKKRNVSKPLPALGIGTYTFISKGYHYQY